MTPRRLAIGLSVLAAAHAADWPQWRGPASQGTSAETGIPTTWSATKNIAWKSPLAGSGTSSPIVTGDLLIATSQIGSSTPADGRDPRLARDDHNLSAQENSIPKGTYAESATLAGVQ